MELFLLIYCIVLTLLLVIVVFRLVNTNEKVRRLKKRYDYLLRGRGELNLEELIVEHGHDIEVSVGKVKSMEQRLQGMEDGYGQRIERFESILNQELEVQDKNFEQRTQAMEQSIRQEMHQIHEESARRADRIEADAYQRFATVEQEFNGAQEKLSSMIQSVEARAQQDLRAVENKSIQEIGRVEDKAGQDVSRLEKVLLAEAHRIEQKEDQQVAALDQKLMGELAKEVLNLNNRLILALQKVSIYKYNAFDNLAGEQSFSIAMLDNLNNGVILTSIYGRQQTTTFAKQVEGGKPVQAISPEEAKALEMVVGPSKR